MDKKPEPTYNSRHRKESLHVKYSNSWVKIYLGIYHDILSNSLRQLDLMKTRIIPWEMAWNGLVTKVHA